MYLDLLLTCCFKTADLRYYLVKVLIDTWQVCEDFYPQLLPLLNGRNTSHSFFIEGINYTNSFGPIGQRNRYPSTVSPSYYRRLEVSIFNAPTCGQTNRRIQQTVVHGFIPTCQSNICRSTTSHTYCSNNRQVSIVNFTYLLVTVSIDRQFHVPISHSNRYRCTM